MPVQVSIALAVAAGGALGALGRLGLSLLVRHAGAEVLVGTLVVNVLGCLLFGLCWALHDGGWSRPVSAGVFIGFLGAFTTFSTYAYECAELLEQQRYGTFVLLLVGHNAVGGAAMLLGLWLGRAA